MNEKRYAERILSDEGITSGLADSEAKLLTDWMIETAETAALTPDADERIDALIHRGRKIARLVERLCYHGNLQGANQIQRELGGKGELEDLDPSNPPAVMKQVIEWETMRNA